MFAKFKPGRLLSSYVHILFVDITKHKGVIRSIKAEKKQQQKSGEKKRLFT